MRVMMALLLLTLFPTAEAMRMAINCTSTAECSDGETCVAGDSVTPVQYCVAGTPCGGSTLGSCPSDTVSGQLTCISHDRVYKCLSIDRCDEYFGGSLCSGGCNVNGVQCNGQGSCSVVSTSSDGRPRFGCTCHDGFSGDKCESRSSSGSTTTSSSSSTTSSLAENSSSPTSSSLAPTSSSSPFSSSVNDSLSNSSSSLTAEGGSSNTTQSGSSGSAAVDSDSGGTSSAVFIIIGVLAACIVVGALIFAMYSRKMKREQEAEAGGFGGPAAYVASAAGEMGTGGDTPKSNIVTM